MHNHIWPMYMLSFEIYTYACLHWSNVHALIWAICMIKFDQCWYSHLSNSHALIWAINMYMIYWSNVHALIWAICMLTFRQYVCSHVSIWAMYMLSVKQCTYAGSHLDLGNIYALTWTISVLTFELYACSHLSNVHAHIWAMCIFLIYF